MTGDLASACKDWQGMDVRTRRARLKGWRPRPLNPLSAHHFFGASCKTLWRPLFRKTHISQGVERAPARCWSHRRQAVQGRAQTRRAATVFKARQVRFQRGSDGPWQRRGTGKPVSPDAAPEISHAARRGETPHSTRWARPRPGRLQSPSSIHPARRCRPGRRRR